MTLRNRSIAFLSALALASLAERADACGGTFCDNGPTAMPVDQTGENILFAVDGTTIEAHVQIQYQGDPERFAWIVPMQVVPEVSIGSQALFDRILAGTVPSYGFSTTFDQCGELGVNAPPPSPSGPGAGGSAGASGEDDGVSVLLQKTVGAFEVVVLKGSTAKEVLDWLTDNDYQGIDTAPKILDKYVKKDFVFAALKLTAGAGLDQIHPIVFKYAPGDPCVPIELTSVAAVEDMPIRTFFLSKARMVPENYRHVTVNPLKIDWLNFGANYVDVVTHAVDSEAANGHAFVTEYAGSTSAVVQSDGLSSPNWDATKLAETTPENVVSELQVQGLASCNPPDLDSLGHPSPGTGYCNWGHLLILPILREHLPRPAGVSEQDFYSCVECSTDTDAGSVDGGGWNAAAFAADVEERIFKPARHAADVLAKHAYLTRMYTTISPAEMNEDPLFHVRVDLPEVPLPTLATRRIRCDQSSVFVLPDGREVFVENGGTWPDFDALPWAESVLDVPEAGKIVTLVDNKDEIDEALAAYNEKHGGTGEIDGDAGVAEGGPALAEGGATPSDSSPGSPPDAMRGDAGLNGVTAVGPASGANCGCTTPTGRGSPSALALLAVAALALRRRRAELSADPPSLRVRYSLRSPRRSTPFGRGPTR